MTQPTYEKYKDTGIPWLGDIPEHWDVKKLSHCLRIETGFTPDTSNEKYYGDGYHWITIEDMCDKYIATTKKQITQLAVDSSKGTISKKGELLFSFKLSVGKVCFTKADMYTNEAIATFKGYRAVCASYLYYIAPLFIIHNAEENIYGAKLLNQERIKGAKLPLPPKPEQKAIAEYLDGKTAQIDTLIAKQERLVELLGEKRTALITHTVTKGLNPNTKTKNTGIPWLGDIPEHWDMKRLKFLGHIYSGLSGKKGEHFNKEHQDGFMPFVPFTSIGGIKVKNRYQYVKIENGEVQNTVNYNDLLFLMSSETVEDIARSSLYQGTMIYPVFLNSFCKGFRFSFEKIYPEYINYYYQSTNTRYFFMMSCRGFIRINLKQEYVNDSIALLPPKPEQKAIAEYLDRETENIDKTIDKINQIIEKLKEYRTSIITHAVTGKIKVL